MLEIDAIKALPKAEQHVHILGSIQPETLLKASEECDSDSPFTSLEDIERLFKYKDFPHFISVYLQVIDVINHEKYFEDMAFDLLRKSRECNVEYVEISFSAPDHMQKGLDFDSMMEYIERGLRKGKREFDVTADIRIDLVRGLPPEHAMMILDLIENRPDGIVSIDIGGSEHLHPPKPFSEAYARAKEMGLHLVAHAGEAVGPHSIWDAVRYLGVERVGHGTTAIQDEKLMNHLRERNITIESCPISNVRTGVVRSLEEHPIREFFDRGLSLSVNSDDPSFFWTDMNNEYASLHSTLGFSIDELYQISHNALQTSFLDIEIKQKLMRRFEDRYDEILSALRSESIEEG